MKTTSQEKYINVSFNNTKNNKEMDKDGSLIPWIADLDLETNIFDQEDNASSKNQTRCLESVNKKIENLENMKEGWT